MSETNLPRSLPLALVHHANQYLIAENYNNRQGISQIVEGYAAILHLHDKYGISINLHLSGTLMEAIAWHRPEFFAVVKELRAKGLLNIIGGTYAENVMPLFSPGFNRRQLNEHLWLCRHHLDCLPAEIKICWVPERVWDTANLAGVLTDPSLANGGYRFVLLDNRILYPTNGSYPESPRASFDSGGPYDRMDSLTRRQSPQPESASGPEDACAIYHIAGSDGLVVVPISADLRYWIPPRSPDDLSRIQETVAALAKCGGDNTILVYADDLEKTAGVGGWQSDALERYEAFLQWVAGQSSLTPVLLADWLADRAALPERALEAGTFFELARQWNAGEDYRGWWESAEWSPYRNSLEAAQRTIRAASQAGAERRLLALAWKHLMASAYETAWYDSAQASYTPAPWAKAVAGHARSSLVIAAAARWFAKSERAPSTQLMDIDQDGEAEVVLRSKTLYAVLAPSHGGRLIYLFVLTSQGGAMVVGNPTDDWNFQQELNRYMDWPPNHPGALADMDGVHDRYQVTGMAGMGTRLELTNIESGSRLFGTRKRVVLIPDAPALVVCYRLPDGQNDLVMESCLSPDYYRLLREGRDGLHPSAGQTWSGFCNGETAAWVGLAREEETAWGQPAEVQAGHGSSIRIQAHAPHFHVLIGCRQTDDQQCQQLIGWGRNAFHRMGKRQTEKTSEVHT